MIDWDPTIVFEVWSYDAQYKVQGLVTFDKEDEDEVINVILHESVATCREWYAQRKGEGYFYDPFNYTERGEPQVYGTMGEAMRACSKHHEETAQ